jgi:hypothetical protein
MRCKECLLIFGATEEPELRLNDMKPMIGLKRFSCFGEGSRVSCQELCIGGWSLSLGVPSPIATTSWRNSSVSLSLDSRMEAMALAKVGGGGGSGPFG